MRVVVLRPEPGASATLARALALGLRAEAHPLFRVELLPWTAPEPLAFDGLLLTSANAVRHAGPQLANLSGLPTYAVGKATADAAERADLDVAASGNGGVVDLLAELPADIRLLHLCGEERIDFQPVQALTAIPVYRSVVIEPAPGLEDLGPAVLLVHSPRAGRRVAEMIGTRAQFRIAAISAAAAAACGDGWGTVAHASEPGDTALLSLAARLCQQSPPK